MMQYIYSGIRSSIKVENTVTYRKEIQWSIFYISIIIDVYISKY